MSKSTGYVALDKNLIVYLPKDRPYTELEAMFSFTCDLDNCREWSINGYSKLWGWSRNKVRYFVNSVRTTTGHLKDRDRTAIGQAVHLINNNLQKQKDNDRTAIGQPLDSDEYTTIKPKPKPKPKNPFNTQSQFEKFWELYPKKIGKAEAQKHFKRTVRSFPDSEDFENALNNYLKYIELKITDSQYIKNGSTFFNQWQDWIKSPITENNNGNGEMSAAMKHYLETGEIINGTI